MNRSSSTASAEADFLLTCVRCYCGTPAELDLNSVDWSKLLNLAYLNGMAPVLYNILSSSPTAPADLIDRLTETIRTANCLNLVRTQELIQILDRLKAHKIAAISFKGLVLAEMAHDNLAMRQFGDLDLLVRAEDFWQAKAILVAQGYSTKSTAIQEATSFHRYCQISLFDLTRSSNLDLHWGIPPRRYWRSRSLELLWQNRQTRSIAGQPIQTFSIEVTLVIQAVNTVKEPTRRSSLRQVCDLAKLIGSNPMLDWKKVWQVADHLRVRKLVLIGLSVAHQLLQVSLPESVLIQTKQIEAIAAQVSQQIIAKIDCSAEECDPFWSEYWYQLRTADRVWHQGVILLQSLTTKLILIGIHLTPNERDRQMIPLPQSLSFLYYVLRILRLTSRYLASAITPFRA